jgi:hypothetical protein
MEGIHSSANNLGVRQPGRQVISLLLVALLASAIDVCASWVLGRIKLELPARIVIALTPIPGNIALLVMILRRIRGLDEFQKRIQFEAVVVGFLATGVAVFVYGYLQKAQAVGPLNMGLVWAFMLLFYVVGYFVAVSHYK